METKKEVEPDYTLDELYALERQEKAKVIDKHFDEEGDVIAKKFKLAGQPEPLVAVIFENYVITEKVDWSQKVPFFPKPTKK